MLYALLGLCLPQNSSVRGGQYTDGASSMVSGVGVWGWWTTHELPTRGQCFRGAQKPGVIDFNYNQPARRQD